MKIVANIPKPVEETYDLTGLTRNELALIKAFASEFFSKVDVGHRRGAISAAERLYEKLVSIGVREANYPFTDCFR